jgi:acetylornithine deacetylase
MTDLTTCIDELRTLVGFPTVSADSNLGLIHHVAGVLEHHGARVEVQHDPSGQKANVLATFGPDRDGGIVLSGHTDVVPVADQPWSSDPFELTQAEGKLFGRGTCDMKGFIAACLALAPRFAEAARKRPLHLAFTYDEEVGCLGGQALVDHLRDTGLRPAMAIIGEPTEMRVIEGHKGCFEYTTRFTGLEGHGSSPDLGVNAVDYAVRYVTRLLELSDRLRDRAPQGSAFDPPWSTINTGALHGGIAHNVIPGTAEVEWEMRPVQASDAAFVKADLADYVADTLLPAMRRVDPRARIETETIAEVEGLDPMDDNAARDLCMELTGANGCGLVPFGTEAGLFQTLGCSAVVCGPGSIAQAHKPDEYVAVDQLAACLAMLTRLTRKL